MIEACPVCQSTDVEVRGIYRSTHATFARLQRAHCRSCEMVFATPMPRETVLEEYNANYFVSAHGGKPRNASTMAFFSGIARLRLAYLERYLGRHNIDVSSLMELGPGLGFFARNWLEKHPASTYMAIETDTSCHAILRDLGVRLVEASARAEENTPVDLLVMSHVLEHVSNPIKFIKDATRNLRKGGAVFIEVPCRDWEHKPIDEPHLLFFDKRPMQHLLNALGFDDIQVSYHGREIDWLRSASVLRAKWIALRFKLIDLGVVTPFAWARPGMETLADPLERAAVAPYNAHRESSKPAWWLRVVAQKTF